ncbi:MAG: hypothetical protein QNJ72_19015 [Pleurocapsa sp. MO_226.B13]|nr:hypothetical protein [Pleurocapsa sp. MO_226.B13]
MSGSIELSTPYDYQYLQELHSELASYGLPSYHFDFNRQYEDIILPGMELYGSKRMIIRRLKTIAIELEYNPNWTPDRDSVFISEPIFMSLVKEVFGEKKSHFIWHYDFCGLYIPVDLTDGHLAKGCLYTFGFSINLARELKEFADKLDFEVENYPPSYTKDYSMYFEDNFYDFTNNILVEEKFV